MMENQDQFILEQEKLIGMEIASSQPLISSLIDIKSVLNDYDSLDNNKYFISGINYLSHHYLSIRKVRGDGNCFYRSFLYGYLENLLVLFYDDDIRMKDKAIHEQQRLITQIQTIYNELIGLGYPEFAIESFYDEFIEIVTNIFDKSRDSLLEIFLEENGKCDYCTWFMRLITAGYIKKEVDRFSPFIEGIYLDTDSYCKAEVEPMGKECEQIHIIALSEFLGITVLIEYLDGRFYNENNGLSKVIFPEQAYIIDNSLVVKLLYRPGHYDILYNS